MNTTASVRRIISAVMLMRSALALAVLRMNTPTGTPRRPAIPSGAVSRTEMWSLVWRMMRTKRASETVLTTTTTV